MLQAINTWEDYRAKLREFDAVLEHAKAVGAVMTGMVARSSHGRYGAQVFVKLLSHCIALRALAADTNRRSPRELLDVPSMSALARCVVEAHDAFEYVAGHNVTPAERTFRLQLWELHDQIRRLKMFTDLGWSPERLDDIRADVKRRQDDLQAHEFFARLPPELQAELRRRWAKGDPPAFHLGQRQRCELSGVNADWHNIITSQLAQYAHTLPSSVEQMTHLAPGSVEVHRLLAMPLVASLPFLVRVTQAIAAYMPANAPEPPSRTSRTMALWRQAAELAP